MEEVVPKVRGVVSVLAVTGIRCGGEVRYFGQGGPVVGCVSRVQRRPAYLLGAFP